MFHRTLLIATLIGLSPAQAGIILNQGQFESVDHRTHADPIDNWSQVLLPDPNRRSSDVLPLGTQITQVTTKNQALIITLDLPEGTPITETLLEHLSLLVDFNLDELGPDIKHIHFNTLHNGRLMTLPSLLDIEPVPDKPDETQASRPKKRLGTVTDLSDKTLFVSQAHGWIDYDDFREWSTQRGITHDIVEDFVNSEAINQFLLQYLEGAGAEVFTLRERDMNHELVIVDDADGNSFPANGLFAEIGDPGLFSDSGANGFANFQAPYGATNDPFRDNGGSDRLITTSANETARAVWSPVVNTSGHYAVYVSYSGVGSRPADAKYIVNHGGIETEYTVDQTKHRYVWNYLGTHYFEAGGDHWIALSNASDFPGTTVSADAIRLGGGLGDVIGHNNGELSTHPRWEEGARTWVQYQGASASVYQNGDVSSRSRFADWEHYSQEDSVYVSWHSNAATGNARGTNTYIYSANPPDGSYDTTQAHPGSPELQTAIHDELINDIQAAWDANWQDRGKRSAYFGEVNPNHNDEMPVVLIEMAFHDNATDADALRHPQFRQLVARAIYQGIVKYFATRDGVSMTLLPEPPTNLSMQSLNPGSVHIQWQAPPTDAEGVLGDAASSHMVYLSADGLNFDNGTEVVGTEWTLNNRPLGENLYVQVRAKNAGGLSLPTETLGTRVTYPNEHRVLIVNGFDRLNSGQLVIDNIPDIGGLVDRMYLDQMNSRNYSIQHGQSLLNSGVGFDASSNEALISGDVNLDPNGYAAVIWILGEESSLGQTLNSTEQGLLNTYLNAGGKLFISGAEIAWDLDFLGDAADQDFYNNLLLTAYWADDANTFEAQGVAGSPYANLSSITFDDGSGPTYRVEFPDVLQPLASAQSCLQYIGNQSACTYVDTGTYQVIHLGFPFETIVDASTRNDLMAETMNFFQIPFFSDLIFVAGFE